MEPYKTSSCPEAGNHCLQPRTTAGAEVQPGLQPGAWTLTLPPGPQGSYRLAQLDDYARLRRRSFPWSPPLTLRLQARVTSSQLPGTWGFGLWNDPFSLNLGFGGGAQRFPALPNTAWFFFASPENHLSFRDDKPAQGFLAQTFSSPVLPPLLLGLSTPVLPLLAWPGMARKLRPLFSRIIREDAFTIDPGLDVTRWHTYTIHWAVDQVTFQVDGQALKTPVTPKGPLGLVIWIDNQFVAFPPHGRLSFGTLANPQSARLEVKGLRISQGHLHRGSQKEA